MYRTGGIMTCKWKVTSYALCASSLLYIVSTAVYTLMSTNVGLMSCSGVLHVILLHPQQGEMFEHNVCPFAANSLKNISTLLNLQCHVEIKPYILNTLLKTVLL